MSKQGSYHVNGGGPKDTSFKSFICALLVFLALCIVIYVILVVGRNAASKNEDDKDVEVFEETNDKSQRDKLTAGKRPVETKENEGTTTQRSKTVRTKPTPRHKATTKSSKKEKNIITETTSEATSISDGKTATGKDGSTTPQSEDEEGRNTLEQFEPSSESTTVEESTVSATSEGYTEEKTTPQLIDGKEKEQKLKITAKSPSFTDLEATRGDESTTPQFIDEKEEDASGKSAVIAKETTRDHTTESISEEPATVNLGIDHDIFHGRSSTENAQNSTPEKEEPNTETTTDNSVEVIMGGQKGTKESEHYVYQSTESHLTTAENLLSSTEPNLLRGHIDNNKNIDNFSLTTESSDSGSMITEPDTPQTGQSNTESSPTDDLQNITTETVDSAVTHSAMLRLLQQTTDSSSKTSEGREPTSVIDTTTEDSVTSRVIPPQTTEQYTTQSSVNVKHTQPTTVANMEITLSATTALALLATTQRSTIQTAGVLGQYLPVNQCNSTVCKKVTSKMVNMMNHAADPCDNFYSFACGGEEYGQDDVEEMNSEALLLYMSKINASSEKYLQDFQTFYESCVEHEREFIISERMKFIAELPDYNLTELFIELILTQSMPLFDVGVDIGPNQDYKLQITLPGRSSLPTDVDGWSLSDQIRKICLNEQKHLTASSTVNLDDVYESFKNCQKRRRKISAINFVDNMKPFVKDPSDTIFTELNLARMLLFLDKVQNLLPPDNEIRETQLQRTYLPISIMELNKAYNVVDWATILERLTFNSTFLEADVVDVYFADYLSDVFVTLRQYTEEKLVDMLVLYSKFQLYENTVIPKNQENREAYCMELSRQVMPDVVSTVIYELAHHGKQLNLQNVKIKLLFQKLTDQFRESLENSRLDAISKGELLSKLDHIKLGLITTGNYNATRKNYLKTTVQEDDYQKNVIELIKNYRNVIYSLERTKASASNLLIYFVDHFSTQPKSFYPSEYIVFHPAVFQKTSMDLPPYLQLSKIGLHLSRELARHFDPAGRHFLTTSQISASDNYYNNLIHRTADLLKSYANSTYDLQEKTLDFTINGSLLLNEMIADNAAFRLIYNSFALLKDQDNLPWIFHSYSIEKVFFIAAAQEYCKKTTALNFLEDIYESDHLPSPLKIQNIVSNTKEFVETFQCVEGSAMMTFEELITQFPYIDYTDYSDSYTNFYN